MFTFIVPGASALLSTIGTGATTILNGTATTIAALQNLLNTITDLNILLPASLQPPVAIASALINQLINCLNQPT